MHFWWYNHRVEFFTTMFSIEIFYTPQFFIKMLSFLSLWTSNPCWFSYLLLNMPHFWSLLFLNTFDRTILACNSFLWAHYFNGGGLFLIATSDFRCHHALFRSSVCQSFDRWIQNLLVCPWQQLSVTRKVFYSCIIMVDKTRISRASYATTKNLRKSTTLQRRLGQ